MAKDFAWRSGVKSGVHAVDPKLFVPQRLYGIYLRRIEGWEAHRADRDDGEYQRRNAIYGNIKRMDCQCRFSRYATKH